MSPAKSTDDEVTEQDIDGRVKDIEKLDRNTYHTESCSLPLEVMHIMDNLISGIEDSHRTSTLKIFRRYGYEPRVG